MDRFQKGSGCYQCTECGKRTRETGSGEGQSFLCSLCYHKAGLENDLSDQGLLTDLLRGDLWEARTFEQADAVYESATI